MFDLVTLKVLHTRLPYGVGNGGSGVGLGVEQLTQVQLTDVADGWTVGREEGCFLIGFSISTF